MPSLPVLLRHVLCGRGLVVSSLDLMEFSLLSLFLLWMDASEAYPKSSPVGYSLQCYPFSLVCGRVGRAVFPHEISADVS